MFWVALIWYLFWCSIVICICSILHGVVSWISCFELHWFDIRFGAASLLCIFSLGHRVVLGHVPRPNAGTVLGHHGAFFGWDVFPCIRQVFCDLFLDPFSSPSPGGPIGAGSRIGVGFAGNDLRFVHWWFSDTSVWGVRHSEYLLAMPCKVVCRVFDFQTHFRTHRCLCESKKCLIHVCTVMHFGWDVNTVRLCDCQRLIFVLCVVAACSKRRHACWSDTFLYSLYSFGNGIFVVSRGCFH